MCIIWTYNSTSVCALLDLSHKVSCLSVRDNWVGVPKDKVFD